MKNLCKLLTNKKGQALVETALTLPLLLLILMGIVEFGRIFNAYLIVTNASREGARYAAINSTDASINSDVSNLTKALDQSKITVTINPTQLNRISGDPVTVTVNYNLQIIAPFINVIIPSPYQVSAITTMRVE